MAASSSAAMPSLSSQTTPLQVVEAALQVLQPARRALQPVGGAHVEHQEAVDVADQRVAIEVAGQQVRMARLHAAIAAHVKVPALSPWRSCPRPCSAPRRIRGCSRTPRTSACAANAVLVAVLELDGETDGILHAVAAPGGAHAALHRAQRLAIGVSGFEARRDQFAPDRRQLVDLRTEQVDALPAGDLGVQPVVAWPPARSPATCPA